MTLIDLLRQYRPSASLSHEPAAGCYTVKRAADGSLTLDTWQAGPRPTDSEIEQWQAKAQAKADLTEAQAMLDERYRLFNRANASGNTEDAAEIQSEIQEILAYMQEVRNAAGTP